MRYWFTWLMICLGITSVAAAGDFSGFVAFDLRIFPNDATFPEQRNDLLEPSLILQPEFRHEWNHDRDRLTVVTFARLAYSDSQRRHVDIRELSWLHLGPTWDLLVGVSKVFWGVTESLHLVDVINQTDLVEDPDAEEKLGQPMIRLAWVQDWGALTLFALPYFRERTFPGRRDRWRTALPVETSRTMYDTALEEWHPAFALRWAHAIGNWDIGVAHFWGPGREPRLLPALAPHHAPVLIPHYDVIHQSSLDLQLTLGAWLGKLEVITRSGQGRRFAALVTGFEYTLFGFAGSSIDLGLLAEYLYDNRDHTAPPTAFEDDVFLGLRLGFNDTQDTTLLAGAILDRSSLATVLSVEANRRLAERWTFALEIRILLNIPDTDVLASFRRDDYLQLRIAWYL